MDNTIGLDEELLNDALRLSGHQDRGTVINEALELFVRVRRQQSINQLRGHVTWEGDLDALRRGRRIDGNR